MATCLLLAWQTWGLLIKLCSAMACLLPWTWKLFCFILPWWVFTNHYSLPIQKFRIFAKQKTGGFWFSESPRLSLLVLIDSFVTVLLLPMNLYGVFQTLGGQVPQLELQSFWAPEKNRRLTKHPIKGGWNPPIKWRVFPIKPMDPYKTSYNTNGFLVEDFSNPNVFHPLRMDLPSSLAAGVVPVDGWNPGEKTRWGW